MLFYICLFGALFSAPENTPTDTIFIDRHENQSRKRKDSTIAYALYRQDPKDPDTRHYSVCQIIGARVVSSETGSLRLIAKKHGIIDTIPFGEWKTYFYDSPILETRYCVVKGLLEGPEEIFWPSGKIKRKASYKHGHKDGIEETYTESGHLRRMIYFKSDIVKSAHLFDSTGAEIPFYPAYKSPVPGYDLSYYIRKNKHDPKMSQNYAYIFYINVQFDVDTSGRIDHVELIDTGSGPYHLEAKRLISQMPAWQPARVENKPVIRKMKLPIGFYVRSNRKQSGFGGVGLILGKRMGL